MECYFILTMEEIQEHVNNNTYPLYESFTGITSSPPHGYTNQAYPLLDGNSEILNVLYYDIYDFDASLTYEYNNFTDELDNEPFYRIKGKLTGSKTAILGSDPVTYLFSVFYYDKKGRMIRGISDNHLGGIDYGDFNYLFSGEIRMANTYHNTIINGQQESDVIKWSYSYDHAGRLLEVLQGINTLPDQTILMNKYNELGQLIEKNIHRTPTDEYLQSIDYKYNISGMLKNINHSNLTNQSKVIDFEEELTPDEIVYGIKYDSIYFTVNEVEESVNNPAYLNVLINDVKQILVCHENDTSQKRSISVNESQLYVLEKPLTDSLTYHKLREFDQQEFDFFLDSVSFDNNTLQSVIIDSLMILTEPQFYASGITDSTVVEKAIEQISLFLYKSTGIIYFNEDPDDLFGMDLLYEEGFNVLGGSNMFNGQISGMKWQEKYFDGEKGYGYQYDNLYRLTNANYGEKTDGSWDPNNSFSVSGIEYDFNGNITQLSRSGLVDFKTVQEYGPIDELVYSYDGNHLKSVDDNIPIPSFSENDFNDNGTYNSEEYFYDANGNMVQDDNKGIENIVYNYLNLPQEITLSGNRKIEYIYDASGNKLTQVIKVNGQVVGKTDYINGYIYKDDELECVMFGEGRAVKQTDGTFSNEYFLTDHLGNVRVVFSDTDEDGEADIVREHHYYPYGMKMGGFNFISGAENNYLYQGKELQSAHNLLWYDFGARYFDHQLGRWHSIDPALQFASPYVGMGNNPVIFTDPDGKSVGDSPRFLKWLISAS